MSKDSFLHNLEKFIAKFPLIYKFLKKCKVGYQTLKYHLFKLIGKDKEFIYNRSFFDKNLKWNLPISEAVVDILIKYFNPRSVVDVGCGNAEFLWQFQKKSIVIKGYEGSRHAINNALIDKKFIQWFDLRNRLQPQERYDLALCLEVAEHIERSYSQVLIDSLSNLSDTIIFTAATPGQGGHFHINEQPRSFWINLWKKNNFKYIDQLTLKIKEEFRMNKILHWYSDNLMVFKRYQYVEK
ncbi:class I SAM-dependent methyltransferase [Candidatus Omnitrophota bacterium]